MKLTELATERLRRAKSAYTVRHVRSESRVGLLTGDYAPNAGDVVLARVDEIGQHKRIELADGRKAILFPGDEVVVAFANRYAPNQFEAIVPEDLGPCDLVAAGGVAARMICCHERMLEPTKLTPAGVLTDVEGNPLNLKSWSLAEPVGISNRPSAFAVIGATMDSGKTTAAAGLIRGLVRAGMSVGAAKVTGTGAGGDMWMFSDAGASQVLDFTHAGYASTYRCSHDEVLEIFKTLLGHLAIANVDRIVIEVADGVYQVETAALLADPIFGEYVDGALFAASDALAATAGVAHLSAIGIEPVAVTGLLTASPLAAREARHALGDVPVLDAYELAHGLVAEKLIGEVSVTSAATSPQLIRSA